MRFFELKKKLQMKKVASFFKKDAKKKGDKIHFHDFGLISMVGSSGQHPKCQPKKVCNQQTSTKTKYRSISKIQINFQIRGHTFST